ALGFVGSNVIFTQVAFVYKAPRIEAKRLPYTEILVGEVDVPTPPHQNVDLTFQIDESTASGLTLSILYRSDSYSKQTIEAMASHYIRLLECVVTDMDASIGDAAILSNDEINLITGTFNDPARLSSPSLTSETVHELFSSVATRLADRVAVVSAAGGTHTFDEIQKSSNQLAREIHHLSPSPAKGFPVVCLLPRSAGAIIAALAILKIGAVCVPVDPVVGDVDVIERTGAVFVITESRFGEMIVGMPKEAILFLDKVLGELRELDDSEVGEVVDPNSAAFALYSRDLHGEIQVAYRSHRGTIQDASWHKGMITEITAQDRVSFSAPLSSHLGLIECWSALLSGACSIILEYGLLKDAEAALTFIAAQEVSILYRNWSSAQSCRLVSLYGYGIPSGPWKGCPFRISSVFAPNAETGISHIHLLEEREILPPAGRPVCGSMSFVLDAGRRIMPVDVVGEICVRNDAIVMEDEPGAAWRGKSRWIGDPLGDGVVFATGVLGRWRLDGCMEVMGELGEQIPVNGHVVHTAQVKEAILECTDVIDALISKRRTPGSGDDELVCYVVPRGGIALDLLGLVNFLRPRLSPVDIPASFGISN
ncbi:hypothetical protein HDU67_003095, partial [Dinochytrium kinnereticum]